MKNLGTIVLVVVALAVGVFVILLVRKSQQAGGSGGWLGTLANTGGGVWNFASGLTKSVTNDSMETGNSLASGAGGIVKNVASTASDLVTTPIKDLWHVL